MTILVHPEKEIDRSIENGDWISAFATATSYFEHFGGRILEAHSKRLNIPKFSKKIERMSVSTVVLNLRMLELIDEHTYNDLNKLITERNKLIHEIGYHYTKQRNRATELLETAKKHIRKLETILREQSR